MQAVSWSNLANKLDSVAYHSKEHPEVLIATTIVAAGFIIAGIMLYFDPYFLRYYLDGNIHLLIARRLFDNLTPGIAQLGGVWLPLLHLFLMPLVAIDFLFYTGLAGTIVSITATAITAVSLFRILRLQFTSFTVGIFGSVLYFLNPSVIYMGIIPMMEALFMMFFMLSVYYIQKWYYLSISEQRKWFQYRTILKCAIAVSAASLTRYEGWLLPVGLILFIPLVQFFVRKKWNRTEKHTLQALLSVVLIFGFAGMMSWIVWNVVIFKDPLYSLTGPYSAAAQADSREYNKYYKLNPAISSTLIVNAATEMYGLHVLAVSFLGIVIYLYGGVRKKRVTFHFLTVIMLMMPILVIFGAMVQGSGEIFPIESTWFNGRYLIFLAPLLAFGSSSLLNSVIEGKRGRMRWKPLMTVIVFLLIAGCYAFTFASQTFEYGGSVALNQSDLLPSSTSGQIAVNTAKQLERLYQDGYVVLFTFSDSSAWIMIDSHIPLENFIDPSNGKYWEVSKQSPWVLGNYVILQKKFDMSPQKEADVTVYPLNNTVQTWFDPVTSTAHYWHNNKKILLEHYNLVYENDRFEIFKRK